MASFLLVLADREAIYWVLSEQRMAFPASRLDAVRRLSKGDDLLLYATRGAWHNPGRDRGRVIGTAVVTSPVRQLDDPKTIAGRDFALACGLRVTGVAPYPGGVELRPLVDRLDAFPQADAWSAYLRRPLVPLNDHDASLLSAALEGLPADQALAPRRSVLAGYRSAAGLAPVR